jgi:hypothetical protein
VKNRGRGRSRTQPQTTADTIGPGFYSVETSCAERLVDLSRSAVAHKVTAKMLRLPPVGCGATGGMNEP